MCQINLKFLPRHVHYDLACVANVRVHAKVSHSPFFREQATLQRLIYDVSCSLRALSAYSAIPNRSALFILDYSISSKELHTQCSGSIQIAILSKGVNLENDLKPSSEHIYNEASCLFFVSQCHTRLILQLTKYNIMFI